MTNEITEHLNKAKALLIEKYSDSIDIEASREALKNINKVFEFLEIYANESDTEPEQYEPQETLKSIIEEMQELTFTPNEISGNDVQVLSDLLTDNVERLIKALGLNDMGLSAESKNSMNWHSKYSFKTYTRSIIPCLKRILTKYHVSQTAQSSQRKT